jgi:hypothetical protein
MEEDPSKTAPRLGSGEASEEELRTRLGSTNDEGRFEVGITRAEVASFSRLVEERAAAAVTPAMVVWVENRAPGAIDIGLFWVSVDVPGTVQQVSGTLSPGQAAPFQLGGQGSCQLVLAYIVQIAFQGRYYAQRVDRTTASPCVDAWAFG